MSLSQIGRNGELRLSFEKRQQKTILQENYSRPPLQVMRAIPDGAGCLGVYLLSPSGGIVQHDRYTMHICLKPDSHALLTTPSANRVYRMPQGYAEQDIQITLEQNAIFEYVPEATIMFAEADFRQLINVHLQKGALLLFQDVVMGGRLARDERLQFRHYRNRMIVYDEQGMILYDNAALSPTEHVLTNMGVLESYACWGSFYILGDLAQWKIDGDAFCQAHHDRFSSDESLASLSTLVRNGIAVRMVSQRLEPIQQAFETLRQIVRHTLGIAPEKLRK